MEKTNENYNELISKFALVCDAIENICPDGNGTLVYGVQLEPTLSQHHFHFYRRPLLLHIP